MVAAEPDGRTYRPTLGPLAGQFVLGPVAVGVLAGLRLESLGAPAAAGLGYAAFAFAQIAATIWLFAADRAA
jgi:hypothetical protein